MAEDEPYYIATRENLLRDLRDYSGVKPPLEDVGALRIERVLDLGCGIGQALFPLAVRRWVLV